MKNMKKNFILSGIPGALFYGTASVINWICENATFLCSLIFLGMAFTDDGLFSMLWVGFSLILQGQNWMQKDIKKLLERGKP